MEYVEGHLEVWTSAGRELLSMPAPRSTIGSSETADLVVSDGSVSASTPCSNGLADRGSSRTSVTQWDLRERRPRAGAPGRACG